MDILEQIRAISNNEEKSVAELLYNMGFNFIDSNCILENESKQVIGEIDLLFSFDDCLLIVEVSKDKHSGSAKQIAFFTKWMEKLNNDFIKKQYNLQPKKIIRIYFDLSKSTPKDVSPQIIIMIQKNKKNKIAYLNDYEYFQDNFAKIGSWAKNDFLDWLDYEDESKSKEIDAIQYYIGDTPAFCFVERVDSLLKTCYVSRRRTNDLGYQRTLKKNRVTEISRSIGKNAGLSFPNSILINTSNLTKNIADPEDCPKIVKIHFPTSYSTCRIIDGQHRLLGFSKVESKTRKTYSLPVIALQNYDKKKEIKTFVDINSKQQKIDSNLILLLKSDLEWEKNSKEQKEKIAVGVAKKLNDTFFPNRIYFGNSDEKKDSKITLTTFVSSITSSYQVKDTVKKTFDTIKEILDLIQKYMSEHAFQQENYFGGNRGIRVLFRLLYLYKRNRKNEIILVSKDDFINNLACIMTENLIENLNDLYGEGGANAAADLVVKKLQEKFPSEYKKMVSNLNKLINKH